MTIHRNNYGELFRTRLSELLCWRKTLDSVDSAMNLLFSKLDEAIDDMENGRVLTEEELWAVIDGKEAFNRLFQNRISVSRI